MGRAAGSTEKNGGGDFLTVEFVNTELRSKFLPPSLFASPVFLSGVLSVGGSQRVLEFFRLHRLSRHPGAVSNLCVFEIKRLKTHNCRITRNIDYHVARFGYHPLSILARAFFVGTGGGELISFFGALDGRMVEQEFFENGGSM